MLSIALGGAFDFGDLPNRTKLRATRTQECERGKGGGGVVPRLVAAHLPLEFESRFVESFFRPQCNFPRSGEGFKGATRSRVQH